MPTGTQLGRIMLLGLVTLVLLGSVAACKSSDKVVVDDFKSIADGQFWSYKLSKGLYRLEYTSGGEGASAEWAGGACPRVAETRS